MLFGSRLTLSYWGYAAEYAAHVLNRMTTRTILGRKLSLEFLTGCHVDIVYVVVFNSPCNMYQVPKTSLLASAERQE